MMTRFLTLLLLLGSLRAWAGGLRYPVECENKADCSSSVAGLAISGASGGSVCTGFLIEEHVLVTNFHCIPPEIQKVGASCHNKIHFFFPETDSRPREEADCDKVISLSNPLHEGSLGVDFAILHLETAVQRPTLDVNAGGISDGEQMTIYKVDPGSSGGLLRKINCTAAQNTILNPYFNNNLSPVIDLIPCSIIKGNSGSPVLDSAGQVKAVLSAKSELPLPEGFQSEANSSKLDIALGSNFSCIDLPSSNLSKANLNKECRIKLDPDSQNELAEAMFEKARKKLETELDNSVPKIISSLKKATHNLLEWNFQNPPLTPEQKKNGIQYVFKFAPSCVNLIKEKIARSAGHLRESPVSYNIDQPELEVQATYDDHYRIVSNLNKKTKSISVDMRPQELLQGKDFKIYFDKGASLTLPSCYVKAIKGKATAD